MTRIPHIAAALILITATLLGGCGTSPKDAALAVLLLDKPLSGKIHGGQQPVSGSHVYLFAANTAAYGARSLSLLTPSAQGVATDATGAYVLTDAQGNFNLTNTYACTPNQQVYVLALGGNPGLASGTNNQALALMAALGNCPSNGSFLGDIPNVFINEVSTVAAAYALSGFMTDATHLASGPSAAAQRGLANAFLAVPTLADINTGNARIENPAGNGTVPQAEINTLANILVPCINSNGINTACSTFFAAAKNSAGITPADTIQALLNIAQNPGSNVSTLFALAPASAPFQPTLSAAPNDWTLAVTYFADNMSGPYFPAIDANGSVWVPSFASNTLTVFDPTGDLPAGQSGYTGGGLNQPFQVAIDPTGNVYTINFAGGNPSTVSKHLPSGTPFNATAYSCGASCFFLAIDGSSNVWLAGNNFVRTLNSAGTSIATFTTNGYESGIAIDSANKAFTLGQSRALYHLTLPSTTTQTVATAVAASGVELTALAIDSADNVWYTSNKNSVIGKSDKSGNQASVAAGYSGGGLNAPAGIAIDGSNRVWVANRGNNSISAFTSTGTAISPATGYKAALVSGPRGLAIDASGNVWITNFSGNSVTEFIGAATPTPTPISPATHGQRP